MYIPVRMASSGGTVGEQQAGVYLGRLVAIVSEPEGADYGIVIVADGKFVVKPLSTLRAILPKSEEQPR